MTAKEVKEVRAIASERVLKGFTQEQLAEELGVTRATVNRWETGANVPDVATIVKLADLFCCSTDYLLGRTMERT